MNSKKSFLNKSSQNTVQIINQKQSEFLDWGMQTSISITYTHDFGVWNLNLNHLFSFWLFFVQIYCVTTSEFYVTFSCRAVGTGGGETGIAPPASSDVNPILIMGADYVHHIIFAPPWIFRPSYGHFSCTTRCMLFLS